MGVEIRTVKTITCKHCGSEAVVKYGSYKSVNIYIDKCGIICHAMKH